MHEIVNMLQNRKCVLDQSFVADTACRRCKRIHVYSMKNDPVVMMQMHHVTVKQAHRIRGIAGSGLPAKKSGLRAEQSSVKGYNVGVKHTQDTLQKNKSQCPNCLLAFWPPALCYWGFAGSRSLPIAASTEMTWNGWVQLAAATTSC